MFYIFVVLNIFYTMIKVGLSGNRYSGKSEICDIFRKLTIPVFEADTVLKFIINHDMGVTDQIRRKLPHVYNNSLYIEPKLVAKDDFDTIVDCAQHELMMAYEKFSEKNRGSIYTIFHSSILFERNWQKLMDKSIVVFCPKITRMERCRDLTKNKVSDIAYLMRNEIDDLDKNRMANFVIHNYDGRKPLDQVHQIDQMVIDSYLRSEQTIVSKHY
jgi:dephospho-CoA kinase